MAEDPRDLPFNRESVQNTLRVRDAIRDIQSNMKGAFGDNASKYSSFINQAKKDFQGTATAADKFAIVQEKIRKNAKNVNAAIEEENKLRAKSNKLAAQMDANEVKRQKRIRDRNKIQKQADADIAKAQDRQIAAEEKLASAKQSERAAAAKEVAQAKKDQISINRNAQARIKSIDETIQGLETSNKVLGEGRDQTDTLANDFANLAKENKKVTGGFFAFAASLTKAAGIAPDLAEGFEKSADVIREKKIMLEEENEIKERLNNLVEQERKDAQETINQLEKKVKANKELTKGEEKRLEIAKKRSELTASEALETGAGLSEENLRKFQLEDMAGGQTGRGAGKNIRQGQATMKDMRTARTGKGPFGQMFKALGPTLKAVAKVATKLFKALVIVKAVAKVIEMVEYAMFGVEKEAVELSRAFTMTKEEGFAMRDSIREMAKNSKIMGASHQQLLKMQMAFTKETGMATRLNQDQLETMSLMTRQLGMSEGEAVHLTEAFKASGVSSREGLDNMIQTYNQLKASGEATMTFKTLMNDITKDAELQRIMYSQGAEAAMKQAQAVRRTGLSLAQQRSMAEGTLDFEKTMTNQLELQLLTGKNINMQKAMELAMQGKNGAAVAEMHKQMRQLTAEQRKNPLIMNKMLEMLGMSREEYYEMLNTQQEQNAAAEKQRKINAILAKETKAFNDMKNKSYQDEQAFLKDIDEEKRKSAQKDIKGIMKSADLQFMKQDLIEKGLSEQQIQEKLLNEAISVYSDKQIHDAKVRAGLIQSELSDLESNVTAGEAFSMAMEEVKVLFADLVGSGAIQDITTFLVDFVKRAKVVGFGRAMLGGGKTTDDLREKYGKSFSDVEGGIGADSSGAGAQGAAKVFYKAMKGAGTDDSAVAEMFSRIKTQDEFEAIKKAYGTKDGWTLDKWLKGDLGEDQYNKYMSQISRLPATSADDFIMRPGQPLVKFNKGDIVMGGTNLGGSDGRVAALLERLVTAVEAGGDVIMDGNKVGTTIAMTKSKFK